MKTTRPARAVSRIKPCLVVYNDPEGGLVVMVDAGALAPVVEADIGYYVNSSNDGRLLVYRVVD